MRRSPSACWISTRARSRPNPRNAAARARGETMKILIIDGPGIHPRSAARALGFGLHAKGHGVIVHPIQMEKLGWFKSQSLAKRADQVLDVHQPDVVHVLSSEPWIADAFTGRGVSVVHSAFDRMSRADWVVAPSKPALARMGG